MLLEQSIQESSPIDTDELFDRCMGNIELAERVLSKLQSRFEEEMIELERAFATKDGKFIATIAHRLKGAAANVAAHDLQNCAAMLEESARNDQMDVIPTQLDSLRRQWLRLNEAALPSKIGNR